MIAMQRHPLEAMIGTSQQLDQTDEETARLVSAKAVLVSGRRTLSPNNLGRSCRSGHRLSDTPHDRHDRPYAHARAARQGLLYCASAEIAHSRQSGHAMRHRPSVLGKRLKREGSNTVARLWGKGSAIDYRSTYQAQHAMASQCLTWKLYLRQAQFSAISLSSRAWYESASLYESIANG